MSYRYLRSSDHRLGPPLIGYFVRMKYEKWTIFSKEIKRRYSKFDIETKSQRIFIQKLTQLKQFIDFEL